MIRSFFPSIGVYGGDDLFEPDADGRAILTTHVEVRRKHLGNPLIEGGLVVIRGIDPFEESVLPARAFEDIEERSLEGRKFTDNPLGFTLWVSALTFLEWHIDYC